MTANVLSITGRKAQVDLRINRAVAFSQIVYILGDYETSDIEAQWSLEDGTSIVPFTVSAISYPESLPDEEDPVFTKFTISATAGQVTVTEGDLYEWQISIDGTVVVQGGLDIRLLSISHWRLRYEEEVSLLGEPLVINPVGAGETGGPIIGDLNLNNTNRVINSLFPKAQHDLTTLEFVERLTRHAKVICLFNVDDGPVSGMVLPTGQEVEVEGAPSSANEPEVVDAFQVQPDPTTGAAYTLIPTDTPCNQWTLVYKWGPGSTTGSSIGLIPCASPSTGPVDAIVGGSNHIAIGPQGVNHHYVDAPPPLGSPDDSDTFLATQEPDTLYYITFTLIGEHIVVETPEGQTWAWDDDIRSPQYWGNAVVVENADDDLTTDMKGYIAAVIGRWVPAPMYRKQGAQAANITLSGAYQDLVTLTVHTNHDNVTATIVGTILGNVVTAGGVFIDGQLTIDAVAQSGQIAIPDSLGVSTHSQTWVVNLGAAGTHTIKLRGKKSVAAGASQALLGSTRLTVQFNDNP